MGAWGYGPFQSDQANDWFGNDVLDSLWFTLQKVFSAVLDQDHSEGDEELIAQSGVRLLIYLWDAPFPVEVSPSAWLAIASDAIDALRILSEGPWAEEWDDPAAYRAENQFLIDSLSFILAVDGVRKYAVDKVGA